MYTLLIFAGAGASKAVNPGQYPTTVEFFDALPQEIRGHPLFTRVDSYLRQSLPDQKLDIELILWRLQELRLFCETATDKHQFPGWMIGTGNLVAAYANPNANLGHFRDVAQGTVKQLDYLISQINQKVYDLYSALPESDDLARTWTPLLEGCGSLGVRTEIVTTNYDMIIESALDGNPVADNGWRGTIYRTLDVDSWTLSSEATRKGLLTKLHGSVNWSRKGDTVFISDPTFKGAHENHAIIYPGFKGRPPDATFLSFHEHFRRVLRSAKVAVFVGFAFRDPYINEICSSSLASGTTCIAINPQRVSLPFSNKNSIYIEQPFDVDSVAAALNAVRDALRLT
ncbi:MAG: SIR2 family protein [Rhodospirillaceae bacterium]